MATFVLDENGLPVFPLEHQLTFDMATRNEQLIEEDNRILDSGLITFHQEMNPETLSMEILNVDITSH
eukprot:2054621-Ditylum_brightwellii.AAC.1